MTGERKELFDKTVKRLSRVGVNDPTAQIIYLAEEIEQYREKIRGLEEYIMQHTRPKWMADQCETCQHGQGGQKKGGPGANGI